MFDNAQAYNEEGCVLRVPQLTDAQPRMAHSLHQGSWSLKVLGVLQLADAQPRMAHSLHQGSWSLKVLGVLQLADLSLGWRICCVARAVCNPLLTHGRSK
jgi:hypothetical protein